MSQLKDSEESSQAIIRLVKEIQEGTGFGSIEITLHEGRITQIEKREKLRFIKDNEHNQKYAGSSVSQALNIVKTRKIN